MFQHFTITITTGSQLGRFEPSPPSTLELHDLANLHTCNNFCLRLPLKTTKASHLSLSLSLSHTHLLLVSSYLKRFIYYISPLEICPFLHISVAATDVGRRYTCTFYLSLPNTFRYTPICHPYTQTTRILHLTLSIP